MRNQHWCCHVHLVARLVVCLVVCLVVSLVVHLVSYDLLGDKGLWGGTWCCCGGHNRPLIDSVGDEWDMARCGAGRWVMLLVIFCFYGF